MKPANFILVEGRLKMIDFGLATEIPKGIILLFYFSRLLLLTIIYRSLAVSVAFSLFSVISWCSSNITVCHCEHEHQRALHVIILYNNIITCLPWYMDLHTCSRMCHTYSLQVTMSTSDRGAKPPVHILIHIIGLTITYFFKLHLWRHPGRVKTLCMQTKMIHRYTTGLWEPFKLSKMSNL